MGVILIIAITFFIFTQSGKRLKQIRVSEEVTNYNNFNFFFTNIFADEIKLPEGFVFDERSFVEKILDKFTGPKKLTKAKTDTFSLTCEGYKKHMLRIVFMTHEKGNIFLKILI